MFSVNYKWVFEKRKKKKELKESGQDFVLSGPNLWPPEIPSDYTKRPLLTHTLHLSEQSQAQP
jgi:hypothetical protein